ncbi:MAG: tripartite tricarboxylate transporter permease [Nanoarchaeota archaeon]
MFWEILLAIILGVASGCLTGITPGIHINLVAVLLVSSSAYLSGFFSFTALACFIIAMGITHTFVDVVPSIFLGAPDESTALGVLPGHRFLLKGLGFDAIKLSIIGAYFGLLASFLLFIPFYFLIKFTYSHINDYMGYFLILVALYMILRDRTKLWAVFVFVLSGVLGVTIFSLETLKDPLFPLLSGLFGVSMLLMSINDKNCIPEQCLTTSIKLQKAKTLKATFAGNVSAFLTSTLPGLSSSIAATMSVQIVKKLHDDGFLLLLGAIGTAGFSLSLVALIAIEKARNGAIIAVQSLLPKVTVSHIMVFLAVSLVAGSIAFLITYAISKKFASFIVRVPYKALVIGIIAFITVLVILLSGWLGLLVLIVSTCVGLIPAVVKCTRTQAMGCLMVPVMLYFLA